MLKKKETRLSESKKSRTVRTVQKADEKKNGNRTRGQASAGLILHKSDRKRFSTLSRPKEEKEKCQKGGPGGGSNTMDQQTKRHTNREKGVTSAKKEGVRPDE